MPLDVGTYHLVIYYQLIGSWTDLFNNALYMDKMERICPIDTRVHYIKEEIGNRDPKTWGGVKLHKASSGQVL